MDYYKLSTDMDRKNDIVCHYKNDYGIGLTTMQVGRYFEGWDERFEFYYSQEEGHVWTDYLANDKGWFLVSERLKDILNSLNTEVQFIKVIVREINGKGAKKDFYIANILKVVDALCLEKSKYFETEIEGIGIVYTVSKYAIYIDKTDNADVFKLANKQEIPVFVSERFKRTIEEEKITGMSFYKIEAI